MDQPVQRARGRELRTRVLALGGERHRLELEGILAPGWAGNLAAGLVQQGVSIERGAARGAGGGVWSAHFEVVRGAGAADLVRLDLGELARRDAGAGFATPLRLGGFRLASSVEHEGSLHLELEADDCVGFLAALLRRLAYFSLFPAELRLETVRGRIADELWLRAGGHRPPSTTTREALWRALSALVDD